MALFRQSLLLSLMAVFLQPKAGLCLAEKPGKTAPESMPALNPYTPGETIDIHKTLSDREWPQLGNTPQRTSYSPVKCEPPWRVRWHVRLDEKDPGNRTYGATQAIFGGGQVYVGCKNGMLYAFDASTGDQKWKFQAGGEILHTAAYADGKVFFGAMDGCVYALDAKTGEKKWVFSNRRRFGFSTAMLFADGRLFTADRGGRMFALKPADGAELWHYDAEAPVLQSAAWNDGKIFFASEDMRVHSIAASDGGRVWRSQQVAGISFMDYYPVVVGGKVIVRPMMGWSASQNSPNDFRLGNYKEPLECGMFVLDEKTGQSISPFEHYQFGMHGPHSPPAVTCDGLLVVPWPLKKLGQDDVGRAWVLQDIQTQKLAFVMHSDEQPATKGVGWGPTAFDETYASSVIGGIVFISHHHNFWGPGGGRGYLSNLRYAYHLGRRDWNHCPLPKDWVRVHNTHGGGANAVSAANGLLYQIGTSRWLACYESAPQAADVSAGAPAARQEVQP